GQMLQIGLHPQPYRVLFVADAYIIVKLQRIVGGARKALRAAAGLKGLVYINSVPGNKSRLRRNIAPHLRAGLVHHAAGKYPYITSLEDIAAGVGTDGALGQGKFADTLVIRHIVVDGKPEVKGLVAP